MTHICPDCGNIIPCPENFFHPVTQTVSTYWPPLSLGASGLLGTAAGAVPTYIMTSAGIQMNIPEEDDNEQDDPPVAG